MGCRNVIKKKLSFWITTSSVSSQEVVSLIVIVIVIVIVKRLFLSGVCDPGQVDGWNLRRVHNIACFWSSRLSVLGGPRRGVDCVGPRPTNDSNVSLVNTRLRLHRFGFGRQLIIRSITSVQAMTSSDGRGSQGTRFSKRCTGCV